MPVLMPFSDTDLPPSIIQEYRTSLTIRVMYIALILVAILFAASLPFMNVHPIVKGAGAIRSEPMHFGLLAPVNGTVVKVLMKENQVIGRGDTLIVIEAD